MKKKRNFLLLILAVLLIGLGVGSTTVSAFSLPNCKTQSPDRLYSADATTIIATQTKPMPEISICALTKGSAISINPASAGTDSTK